MVTTPDLPRISDYLDLYARSHPNRDLVTHRDLRLTYRAVQEQSIAYARALLAAGVRKGDRVAAMGNPRPEFFVSFLAAARIGAVWQGLNPKYTPSELLHVVGDAGPRVIFALDGEYEPVLQQVRADAGMSSPIVTPGESLADFLRSGEAVTDETLQAAEAAVESHDPAAIVYTSGTTGRPKGALLPHRGLVLCSLVQADRWYEDAPRILCDLPINHVGCLGDICCSVFVVGGSAHLEERFHRTRVLDVIARERIEYWLAIPTMFQLVVSTPEWADADLSSIKRAIWGGAAASRELILELQSRMPVVCTSYGMTETVGSVTYTDDHDDLATLVRSVGRPDPRYEVRVARDDGTPCAPGEEGEVQVRGDFLMRGYLNRPDATAEAIDADGWLHTGDLGKMDAAGELRLAGRLTEMFKSGGYNVYPREIEMALEGHPEIAIAAVVGVPDALYSEVGNAFVVPDRGAEIDPDELRTFLRERLANYKIPKRIEVREELPRLAIGKVDKRALRDSVASE
jgi:fatty-acyl-CoA synthase